MEVTRENFKSVLADLPNIFKNAQFITIDTEFTGLRVEGASNINYFDTLDDLYLKDRLKVETFTAIQCGIVAFFFDKETNNYTHQGFNFYVYPSSNVDINFTCQNKCIDFLAKHGFDFNKLFRAGIPYLNEVQTDKMLERLKDKYEKSQVFELSNKMDIAPEHQTVIDDIFKKIKTIHKKKTKETFTTERQNSFLRKLIYNAVQHEFGDKILLESNKNETMTITVGFSLEEIKEKQKEKYLKEKNEILDETGFSKVIKLLINCEKLLIGHNFFLDLLFIVNQFLTPLPNTYSGFKELVKFVFPKIIDTKHMASSMELKNLKDTSLYTLLEHFLNLNEIPFVRMVENGKGYNIKDKKLHEAAFDAYLTGLCFLGLLKKLGSVNFNTDIFKTFTNSTVLNEFLNKLYVPKLHDIHYLNIGGQDNEPDRVGVYHLKFPIDWTRKNIIDLFKDYGFPKISWIDSTSAFIQIKKEFIKDVDKNLVTLNSEYKLCTYSEFKSATQNFMKTLINPSEEKMSNANFNNSRNNDNSPFKTCLNDSLKRKQVEDIGEIIERPEKKICSFK